MKKVIVLICLISLFISSCSDDDKYDLKSTQWEYVESVGNSQKIHLFTFTGHTFIYTIYTESGDGYFSETDVFEFEGNYVYHHPDVKLELHGARVEFTCSENKMISKEKEAGAMVFTRK